MLQICCVVLDLDILKIKIFYGFLEWIQNWTFGKLHYLRDNTKCLGVTNVKIRQNILAMLQNTKCWYWIKNLLDSKNIFLNSRVIFVEPSKNENCNYIQEKIKFLFQLKMKYIYKTQNWNIKWYLHKSVGLIIREYVLCTTMCLQ